TKRWTHFHSVLQLVINRAAHKWIYKYSQECFVLWCKEEPHRAEGIFNTISWHMEDQVHASCEWLFKDYSIRENINMLHTVDLWKEDLDPQGAVHASMVLVLQAERERLKETLHQLEEENIVLYEETVKNAQKLLKHVDEVCSRWNNIPHDEIGLWSLQVV
ncbi:hypothetical protein BKA82DRAFT_4231190, partial [Pisolithus tinctorius]